MRLVKASCRHGTQRRPHGPKVIYQGLVAVPLGAEIGPIAIARVAAAIPVRSPSLIYKGQPDQVSFRQGRIGEGNGVSRRKTNK